jgi:hypothetical protein
VPTTAWLVFQTGRPARHGHGRHGDLGSGTALLGYNRTVPCHQARQHVSVRAGPGTKSQLHYQKSSIIDLYHSSHLHIIKLSC